MTKRLVFIALALAMTVAAKAQERPLSDSAFASLITCGQGDDYYLSWGHTAIRVCDPARHIDWAYNYGTFDFDTPHFYWKFCLGELNYCLSRTAFGSFLAEYNWERRAVWEQRLRLTPQEVNNLYLLLETNYLPEYRYYKYNFYQDNCATRVRDMIAACLDHRTLSPEVTADTAWTYRDYVDEASKPSRLWWQLGVDIVLGMPCDKRCSNYEAMFSPLEMKKIFDTLTVSDTRQPLAEEATLMLRDAREPMSRSLSPTLLFWMVAAVAVFLTVMERRKGWRLTAMDRTLYIVVTLISLVVIFLWFFTSHYCTKGNLNILWASPLFLYFAICLKRRNRWVVWLQVVMLLAAVALCYLPYPQRINEAVCPIALTLALRLLSHPLPRLPHKPQSAKFKTYQ